MTGVYAYDSNSISTLFSGLNSQRSGNSGSSMGIDLSTYGLIRSGSYYKLMQSYFSLDGSKEAVKKAVTGSTATSEDSAKTLASVKSSSEALIDSSEALYKSNSEVFKKVTTEDENGKQTTDYDREAIYKAVDQFISDYNSAISAAGQSKTSSIANAAESMVNHTANNASLLGKVGIRIDADDDTLSIDKDTFMKADISRVRSLFNGNGSYAYATAVKASMVNSYANIESSKSNTYNSSGKYTYNYNTGALYNSVF